MRRRRPKKRAGGAAYKCVLVRELSTRRMTLRGAVALFIAREMMDHAPGGRSFRFIYDEQRRLLSLVKCEVLEEKRAVGAIFF